MPEEQTKQNNNITEPALPFLAHVGQGQDPLTSVLCPVLPSHASVVRSIYWSPGGLCGGQRAGPAGKTLQGGEQEESHLPGGC